MLQVNRLCVLLVDNVLISCMRSSAEDDDNDDMDTATRKAIQSAMQGRGSTDPGGKKEDVALARFVEKYSVGKRKFDPEKGVKPPNTILTRELDEAHASDLAFGETGFLRTGTVNELVIVAILTKSSDKAHLSYDKVEHLPHYVICGLHTTHACKMLKAKYPNNPRFGQMSATFVICPDTTRTAAC